MVRIVALGWLVVFAYVVVFAKDYKAATLLGPTAAMAGGYLFGSDVIGAIRERRNGKAKGDE